MLASLDVGSATTARDSPPIASCEGGSFATASATDLLESMDISALLRQMDSAQGALDLLETRTDSLMQKIDFLLSENEAEQMGHIEEVDDETTAPLHNNQKGTTTIPPSPSDDNDENNLVNKSSKPDDAPKLLDPEPHSEGANR
ncbi:hypothetical protein HDU86_005772 [Geranomyces michiganensis]|nr:hypothetical protein HDU86_005772 [Geranomyces michiganensis]